MFFLNTAPLVHMNLKEDAATFPHLFISQWIYHDDDVMLVSSSCGNCFMDVSDSQIEVKAESWTALWRFSHWGTLMGNPLMNWAINNKHNKPNTAAEHPEPNEQQMAAFVSIISKKSDEWNLILINTSSVGCTDDILRPNRAPVSSYNQIFVVWVHDMNGDRCSYLWDKWSTWCHSVLHPGGSLKSLNQQPCSSPACCMVAPKSTNSLH